MTIGVVTLLSNGSIVLSKLLHGHVSRVRSIDVQNGRILSGSDDRSLKLWMLDQRKLSIENNNNVTSTTTPTMANKKSTSLLPELQKKRLMQQQQNGINQA
jgi:WD40 repeat protein